MSLRDKVRFECEPLCLGVQVDAEVFMRRVKETLEIPDEMQTEFASFAYIYAATSNIVFTFDGKERPALVTFKATWERRKQMTPAELWQWRLHTAHALLGLWTDDYLDAQNLVDVDPGQLPTDKLTEAQRKELANPDSPLASSANNSPAA